MSTSTIEPTAPALDSLACPACDLIPLTENHFEYHAAHCDGYLLLSDRQREYLGTVYWAVDLGVSLRAAEMSLAWTHQVTDEMVKAGAKAADPDAWATMHPVYRDRRQESLRQARSVLEAALSTGVQT